MPARAAAAKAVLRPAPADPHRPADDGLREALLARVRPAAWAAQDAEIAALEATGECAVPSVAELTGLTPDRDAGPPEGGCEWLADLPGPLRDEYVQAMTVPPWPEPIGAGWWDRSAGDGCGFAAGGVGEELAPGPVLAGLIADVVAVGLDQLSDDELIGVLRAGRRLASWSASVTSGGLPDRTGRCPARG
jgi:hypothetical protein